jgi:sRNA-binding carbon storage regulator CsrA
MSRLVITRKVGEKITLKSEGQTVADISVGKVDRNQVRVVVEADAAVEIIWDDPPKKDKHKD